MNKAFRAKWVNAGYCSRMGSAEVVPPPPNDFIRLYHITTAELAVSDVALARLKVARFLDLNDPFELMALNLREGRRRKIVRDFKNAYDSETGLLCFSANWVSPVLWSHYGNRHRGVCLGFNVKRTLTRKVRYEDRRVLDELGDRGDPSKIGESIQDLLIQTKFRHWEYEKEHRMFVLLKDAVKEGTMHFRKFDQDLQLAEVILGPQCNLSLDTVRELARRSHPQAVAFRARLAFQHFAVVPDERTVRILRSSA